MNGQQNQTPPPVAVAGGGGFAPAMLDRTYTAAEAAGLQQVVQLHRIGAAPMPGRVFPTINVEQYRLSRRVVLLDRRPHDEFYYELMNDEAAQPATDLGTTAPPDAIEHAYEMLEIRAAQQARRIGRPGRIRDLVFDEVAPFTAAELGGAFGYRVEHRPTAVEIVPRYDWDSAEQQWYRRMPDGTRVLQDRATVDEELRRRADPGRMPEVSGLGNHPINPELIERARAIARDVPPGFIMGPEMTERLRHLDAALDHIPGEWHNMMIPGQEPGILVERPGIHYDPVTHTLISDTLNAQHPTNMSRYIIEPNGDIVEETVSTRRLSSTNQLAQRLAATAVVPFRDAGWPADFHVGITSNRAVVYVACRIRDIRIDTHWAPAQDAGGPLFLTPVWNQDQSQGSVMTARTFHIPEDLQLWLVVRVPPAHGNAMYMAVKTPASGWRLPFTPNIYDDGKVCTGGEIGRWTEDNPHARGYFAAWEWGKALLDRAPWCGDLSNLAQTALSHNLIRFSVNANDETQLDSVRGQADALWDQRGAPNHEALNWLGEVVR